MACVCVCVCMDLPPCVRMTEASAWPYLLDAVHLYSPKSSGRRAGMIRLPFSASCSLEGV